MTHTVFARKAAAWLLATLMMFPGDDVAMASSLKLADPLELAGKWQATLNALQDPETSQDNPSNICFMALQPNQTLGDGADCLATWLGEQVVGWFPEPDGIAMTGKEGSRIVFFSRQHEGLYKSTLKSGQVITLQRAAH